MHHPRLARPTAALVAFLALAVVGCGGGSEESSGTSGSSGADGATTTSEEVSGAGTSGCPDETTYEIRGPQGTETFTAASTYAYGAAPDYLSIYLFSKDTPADDVPSLSTGFRTDDPGTVFASLHTRADQGETSEIEPGPYVADSPEAQQALEPGRWITDVAVSLGLEQVASGFPPDSATKVDLTVVEDDRVCGTITSPYATAEFDAVRVPAGS